MIDKDAAGYPTVGYGHLCSNSKCTDVKYPIPLSKANGKKLLADDMRVSLSSFPSLHLRQPVLTS
jgi:lysozyme